VDFSDRIARPLARRGYDTRTTWELAAQGEPETTMQKFLRLKCEFQELLEEVQKNGLGEYEGTRVKPEDIAVEVSEMQSQLQNTRVRQAGDKNWGGDQQVLKNQLVAKIGEISGQSGDSKKAGETLQYELNCMPGSTGSINASKVIELESRLQRLENVLGAENKDKLATVALLPKNQTILGSLSVLNARLGILEPSHIELIEDRLSSILQKVTKIAEKKLDVEELERTLKLSDLYDLMEESSGTLKALPELMARLEALRELHESAGAVGKNIENVKSLQEFIVSGTVENENTLKTLTSVLTSLVESSTK